MCNCVNKLYMLYILFLHLFSFKTPILIDLDDFDNVVYLEINHSFITLFYKSDKYTFWKMGVFNEKRCKSDARM